MVTPELKCPITNFTRSPANLLATETPSFGSARSSPSAVVIRWPRIPPTALMSVTACSTPFLICAPNAALPAVRGAPIPNLTSAAEAQVANTMAAPNARPNVTMIVGVRFMPDRSYHQNNPAGSPTGSARRRVARGPQLKGNAARIARAGGSPKPIAARKNARASNLPLIGALHPGLIGSDFQHV